ncbi:polysaccharide lyase family 14 protein [Botryobasidium botryosum FD-172 SS1]|uniref:Polysaccharide lyase family 14 protein n=1 Tax=Botryobasidium botryosum (strain FD-172 SS1) TaxID=930990 RepID=A0A067MWW2_BOTB1|nr:polysaccharide lyase family 14 protein [Botryobasidium botryosum FD-172 SS1]
MKVPALLATSAGVLATLAHGAPSSAKAGPNSKDLFPVPFKSAFTTSSYTGPHVQNVEFVDKALGVVKVSSGTTHKVVLSPDTSDGLSKAWEAFYPKDSMNPSSDIRGGFGFYMAGPSSFAYTSATEALFSYSVYFEPGFQFNLGGKIPGLYGGATADLAYGCSGGRQDGRDKCFSLRFMWRKEGDGELYAYLPTAPENDAVLLKVPPFSERNPDYGFSVGRGSWKFIPGEWATMAQGVKLNDIGKANGEIEIWVNGKVVIKATGIVIRQGSNESVIRGAHFQTFFGGSTDEWNSPKDQYAYFSDISGGILA